MSQEKKITDAELAEIKSLQAKFQTTIEQLGIVSVEKLALTKREKSLQDEWEFLQKAEKELMDKIVRTYGEGSLNINTGVMTPETSPPQ